MILISLILKKLRRLLTISRKNKKNKINKNKVGFCKSKWKKPNIVDKKLTYKNHKINWV